MTVAFPGLCSISNYVDAATAKNLKADLRTNKWDNILSSSVSGLI